jgi:hypothetical protein
LCRVLIGNNPVSPLNGQPLTFAPNPFGFKGDALPQSPPLQANMRARYEWTTSTQYHPFVQASQGIATQPVIRPRVVMLRGSWNFGK